VNNQHTLERHSGKSNDYLIGRITSGETRNSSTYLDKPTAQRIVDQTINQNRSNINRWLRNPNTSQSKSFDYNTNQIIGRGIKYGETSITPRSAARTVLRKNSSGGFDIVTSFPIN
jgi:filamentous hemagglutinin